ncbi:MAG: sensor histidine kinase [Roseiflexaceae bacterium]|nr:sensor histidine kinase [Roseiflexaceae bacterium]
MTHPDLHSDERQRRNTLVLRTLPILLIPFGVSIATFLILRFFNQGAFPSQPPTTPPPFGMSPLVPITIMVIFFSALIVLVRVGRPTISALLLIGVWTLFTTASTLRAGVTSYFPALLIIPICAAGLLIDRAASLSLAALATVLVYSMALLEVQGRFIPEQPPQVLIANMPYISIGFWVGLFWTIAALTSLLAGGLHQALVRSRNQAEELARLRDQLEARVAAQTDQLLEQEREAATLEERTRLAREIHDTIAQGLAGVVVQLGAVQRALVAAPDDAPPHLDLAQRMAREALAEARRSVWNLRAKALDHGAIGDALHGLVERQAALLYQVSFKQVGEARALAPETETALLRVAQESLANAAKYASKSSVSVELAYLPDHVRLTIRDSGPGFAADVLERPAAPGPWGGFGLLGMRERIAALGGSLVLHNEGGAVVDVLVPDRRPIQEEVP